MISKMPNPQNPHSVNFTNTNHPFATEVVKNVVNANVSKPDIHSSVATLSIGILHTKVLRITRLEAQ